jgi:zinc protease
MSKVSKELIALAAALLIAAACAQAPSVLAKEPTVPHVQLDFQKYTLPNGLEVILRQDKRLPIAAVNIWYHVGPAYEEAGRTGFAHLFEHMMFQASGHVQEDKFWSILEGAGASFINGSTDFDRTNYLEDVPSNQLETALWLESDRMGFLLDRLDATMLARQQDVVRNERRQTTENSPYGLVEEAMWHQLFPKGHPYYPNVIGSHADIQAAKLEDVRDFFRRYYAPNNASLCIVGDIDFARTKALVEKYFATIQRGPAVPPLRVTTPPITSERRQVVTDKVELPRVYIAWITAPIYKPGDADCNVAARILAGGKASRLYKSLVYEKQIAQSVSAMQQSLMLGSVFQIQATAKPGHTPAELEQAIDAELARLAAEGPTAEEVDAARNMIWTQMITSLEQIGGFSGIADRLNQYNQFLKDPDWINKDIQQYARVTPQTLRRVFQNDLRREARVVIEGVPGDKVIEPGPPSPPAPEKSAETVQSAEPWRNEQPKPGPASTAPLPAAQRFTLPNGLTVFLVESHQLPVVATHLIVRTGSAGDPHGLEGLAGFTAAMLDEGTAKRDALSIARELEENGASLGTGAYEDGSFVSGQALKQNADALLDILSDVTLSPTFDTKEIERVRNTRLTSLLQQRDSPFRTAIRVLAPVLYGEDNPYGHNALGREAGIKKVSRDDLVAFYGRSFSPANAALVFAGDLSAKEARALAEKALGGWKGAAAAPPAPAAPTPLDSRVFVVDKSGSPQTAVLFGQIGVARSAPDYEELNVAITVLGGLFSSRVNMNLREDKGWTYGAFSFMPQMRGPAPLYIGANVQSDATGGSVTEIYKEIDKLLAEPVTAGELAMAKDSIARSLPALFQTTGGIAGTIGQLYMYDQPPDYYQNLPAQIQAMTADEVFAATKRNLDPARMRVVLVGDRAKIVPQLEPLKLGTVTFMDADGQSVQ